MPVRVDGNKVTFSVPAASDAAGEFRGRISKAGFDGIWRHIQANGGFVMDDIHFPRKNSYWQ